MTVPTSPSEQADVVPLRPAASLTAAAEQALAAVHRHLARCKLAPNTVKAYRRQTTAYVSWLTSRTADHPDAFADTGGAEAAVTAWRRHLIRDKASPASINQALAAVTLLYDHAGLRVAVKRARVPRPANPMPSPLPSRAPPNEPLAAAAPATPPSSPSCSTPEPARKNAHDSTPRTSRSPPAPARSACTARATRSASFPFPRSPATVSPPGWTNAAATRGRCGPDNAARSPSPASSRSS